MPYPEKRMFYDFKLDEDQKKYVDSMYDNQLTIVDSKAGTGKTTLAVGMAYALGMKLVYVFAPVQETTMGYRPGTQKEKESDYLSPLHSALIDININPSGAIYDEELARDPVKGKEMLRLAKEGKCWVFPKSHTFVRGTNIRNRFVIIDEAQNFTKSDLRKVLTRIHDDCKVVVIGNVAQIDLKDPKQSGFEFYSDYFAQKDYCSICELTQNYRGQLAQDADNAE